MGFLLSICTQPSNDQSYTFTTDKNSSRTDELKKQSTIFLEDYSYLPNKETNIIRVLESSECLVYSNKY